MAAVGNNVDGTMATAIIICVCLRDACELRARGVVYGPWTAAHALANGINGNHSSRD